MRAPSLSSLVRQILLREGLEEQGDLQEDPVQFGEAPPDGRAATRPGVYAVILEDGGTSIRVLSQPGMLHLPGGGKDPGESDEDAVRREMMEETGHLIKSMKFIGKANQYSNSVKYGRMNKLCSFYLVELGPRVSNAVDDEGQLVSMPVSDFLAVPVVDTWDIGTGRALVRSGSQHVASHQMWAVRTALSQFQHSAPA